MAVRKVFAALALFCLGLGMCASRPVTLHGVAGSVNSIINSPAFMVGLESTGQSRSSAFNGDPPVSTTPVGSNKQVYDNYPGSADGGWNIADASCSTCVLESLYAFIRQPAPVNCSTGPYPCNEYGGETPVVRTANQITTWSQAQAGSPDYRIQGGEFGQFSQPLTSIQQGTRPYNAMLWEIRQTKAIINAGIDGGPPGTYLVGYITMWHGEADTTNSSYATGLATYATNLVTDITAITGATQHRTGATCPDCIPIVAVIPANGNAFGVQDLSSQEMLWLSQTSSPGVYQAACPTYANPFKPPLTQVHNSNVGYDWGAECEAKFIWLDEKWQAGQIPWPTSFQPLAITRHGSSPAPGSTFVKVGNDVTITTVGAVGAITIDNSSYQPHPAGSPWGAYWSTGKGFELWSAGVGSTPVLINSVTTDGVNHITIHGGGVWSTVAYALTQDGVTQLDGGVYDAGAGDNGGTGAPNGVGGNLRDSDCSMTTISGHCPYNWLTSFYQTM